jgi:hypothetical protein
MKNATITFCIAALFLIFGGASFAAVPDVGGTWTLDATKSEGLPAGINQTVVIKLDGDKVSIETKTITEKGEQSLSENYTLDGKETEYTPKVPNGVTNAKGKRTAKWTADGFEVYETITADAPTGPVTVVTTRKWSLSAGGKTLKIEFTQKLPDGTKQFTRTFIKK